MQNTFVQTMQNLSGPNFTTNIFPKKPNMSEMLVFKSQLRLIISSTTVRRAVSLIRSFGIRKFLGSWTGLELGNSILQVRPFTIQKGLLFQWKVIGISNLFKVDFIRADFSDKDQMFGMWISIEWLPDWF